MIEIHGLDGAGELLLADFPDPVGAVAHNHLDQAPVPAALMRFGVDPAREPFSASSFGFLGYIGRPVPSICT